MEPTRRGFLVGASAALSGCTTSRRVHGRRYVEGGGDTGLVADTGAPSSGYPSSWTWEPGPEPPSWVPEGTEDPVAFAFGVQSGDARLDGVRLSCRTLEPSLTLVLVRGVEAGWEEVSRLEGLVPEDKVVQLELEGLIPDTTYAVAFYAEDGSLRRSRPGRFRTALYPGSRRLLRFGATCCLGGNRPWPSLSAVAGEKLDFFCLLGDTIYADPDWGEDFDHEADWEEALAVDGLKDLCQSTSLVATWDDHEVRNDWRGDDPDMPALRDVAEAAFRRAIPMGVGPGSQSTLWRRLTWGDTVELFVLDCRSERVGERYLSAEQMDWLEAGLRDSTARFKIVCNSVPICDMDDIYFGVGAEDRWDGYPEQREELLGFLDDQGVEGVLFLAGDFHWGAVATIGRPGFAHDDRYEVFCGPAGSPINPLVLLLGPNAHYLEVVKQHNTVLFEADPDAGTVVVRFIDDSGGLIASRTLSL